MNSWYFAYKVLRYFWMKTEKVNITTEFYILKLESSNKFPLKLLILIFWTKSTQRGYFWSKTEKVNITLTSAYSNKRRHQISA